MLKAPSPTSSSPSCCWGSCPSPMRSGAAWAVSSSDSTGSTTPHRKVYIFVILQPEGAIHLTDEYDPETSLDDCRIGFRRWRRHSSRHQGHVGQRRFRHVRDHGHHGAEH